MISAGPFSLGRAMGMVPVVAMAWNMPKQASNPTMPCCMSTVSES